MSRAKNVKRLTEQQAFNKVWRWFVRDRKRQSVNADGTCCYRGPGGTRCAAGVCIPDRLYSPDMEGSHIRADALRPVQSLLPVGSLMSSTQHLHDGWSSANSVVTFRRWMRGGLTRIAESYGLKVPTR